MESISKESWTKRTSHYDVAQHGRFHSESIYKDGVFIFGWSDNNGLCGFFEENEFEDAPPSWVIEKYNSFQDRNQNWLDWCEENLSDGETRDAKGF